MSVSQMERRWNGFATAKLVGETDMGKAGTNAILKYAIGFKGPTPGTHQKFIVRRGARDWSDKIWVVLWALMNVAMFVITVPAFLGAVQLVQLVLVMNYLLLWLVLNVVGFIIIHYTSGPAIIEELSDAKEVEGRGADNAITKPLSRPVSRVA